MLPRKMERQKKLKLSKNRPKGERKDHHADQKSTYAQMHRLRNAEAQTGIDPRGAQ